MGVVSSLFFPFLQFGLFQSGIRGGSIPGTNGKERDTDMLGKDKVSGRMVALTSRRNGLGGGEGVRQAKRLECAVLQQRGIRSEMTSTRDEKARIWIGGETHSWLHSVMSKKTVKFVYQSVCTFRPHQPINKKYH